MVVLGCKGAGNDAVPDGGSADAAVPAGYQMLISRSWSMNSDSEGYKCIRAQVPTDMWISAFRSLSPVGTHHSVLTISTNSAQTGEYDCNAGSLDTEMLYAAGVQTDDNVFPPGVAIHVAAGTYINLNLHLYNTTDGALTDTSGVLVKTIAQSEVVNEADMQFAGTYNLNIPPDNAPHTFSGHCSAAHDFHIFTLWPHMHQLATHQKFTINGTALLDSDYAFTDQKNYPMTDTLVHAGDVLETSCTYVNTTSSVVTFGESSDAEMCFTGVYRYPAGGNLFACINGSAI